MQPRTIQALRFSAVALGLVIIVAGTALAQASNPHIGVWKGNVPKSKTSPGTAMTSNSTRIEAAGAGVKVTVDSVGTDGVVRHWVFTANYDGKDYPITGNSQWGDTVALTRVDANTSRSVYKKGGVVLATQTSVVSADGKTRTTSTKGKNVLGQTVDNVSVYDRQS
jgi:hypothetical protein